MRELRIAIAACVIAGVIAGVGIGPGGKPDVAQAAKNCGYERLGSTYVTSITAHKTSCRKAKGIAKSFTTCRKKHGPSGHCRHKVKRYKCKESRYDKAPGFQYSSRVSCKRGSRTVKLTYTQNL